MSIRTYFIIAALSVALLQFSLTTQFFFDYSAESAQRSDVYAKTLAEGLSSENARLKKHLRRLVQSARSKQRVSSEDFLSVAVFKVEKGVTRATMVQPLSSLTGAGFSTLWQNELPINQLSERFVSWKSISFRKKKYWMVSYLTKTQGGQEVHSGIVDLYALNGGLSRLLFGQHQVYVVDSVGKIFFSDRIDMVGQDSGILKPLGAWKEAGRNSQMAYKGANGEFLIQSEKAEGTPFYAVTLKSIQPLDARPELFVIFLACVGFAWSAIWFFTRGMVQSLAELSLATGKLAQGQTAHIKGSSSRVFKSIFRNLNQMSKASKNPEKKKRKTSGPLPSKKDDPDEISLVDNSTAMMTDIVDTLVAAIGKLSRVVDDVDAKEIERARKRVKESRSLLRRLKTRIGPAYVDYSGDGTPTALEKADADSFQFGGPKTKLVSKEKGSEDNKGEDDEERTVVASALGPKKKSRKAHSMHKKSSGAPSDFAVKIRKPRSGKS